MKVVSDSELISITYSDVMGIRIGATRRWPCYGAW